MTKFDKYKDEAVYLKEQGNLTGAMTLYKIALDHTENDEQRIEIWNLITHVHTDRMLAACKK